MSESKFKVGDRVAAYMTDMDDETQPYRMIGTVDGHGGPGVLILNPDKDELVEAWDLKTFRVHEKQCRRLKKRHRERCWVAIDSAGLRSYYFVDRPACPPGGEIIELVEVRRKVKP